MNRAQAAAAYAAQRNRQVAALVAVVIAANGQRLCTCTHTEIGHTLGKGPQRGPCTVQDHTGKCPCRLFEAIE